MYPPPYYQNHNFEEAERIISLFPLATVISVVENLPVITHIPLILSVDKKHLLGHIDRNNPHTSALTDTSVTLIFHTPNHYISPSAMPSAQLPTINYGAVHIHGISTFVSDKDLIDSIVALTTAQEAKDSGYTLEASHPAFERLLPFIQGFKIEIKDWEIKYKFSQDKSEAEKSAALHFMQQCAKEKIDTFFSTINQ